LSDTGRQIHLPCSYTRSFDREAKTLGDSDLLAVQMRVINGQRGALRDCSKQVTLLGRPRPRHFMMKYQECDPASRLMYRSADEGADAEFSESGAVFREDTRIRQDIFTCRYTARAQTINDLSAKG
jgi:hypothetical protein